MNDAALLFFYAETPVHAGGADSVGVLDLPIQRETASGLPTVWGQSAKGALRDFAGHGPSPWPDVEEVFGSAPPRAGGASGPPAPGWLSVGDLRLVAFPVPTLTRTFAWVTSPLLLARQQRLAQLAGLAGLPAVPHVEEEHVVPAGNHWSDGRVAVGEYDLTGDPVDDHLRDWATWLAANALPRPPAGGEDPFAFFRTKISSDLLLVTDGQLSAITEEYSEVVPRVQLYADAKTVRHGPWYTEYLPAETIACSLLRGCTPSSRLADLPPRLDGEVLVAGGDETLGKGLFWLRWCGAQT
jgi:CRISPR-associated protein Cmr4